MKRTHFLLTALLLALTLAFCGCTKGDGLTAQTDAPPAGEEELVLTLEELAKYDGKDGNPAYIAIDGVVYDVTDVPQWKDGEHNGYSAGQDLTDEIKNISPHGLSKLKGLPVVGKLAD